MTLTKSAYQKTETLLNEIQESCAQGIGNRNARDCLMDVSAVVYQIRKELREGITLEDGD